MAYRDFPRRSPDRAGRWQDGANAILAIWLFLSPWILQFAANAGTAEPATAGTNVLGVAAWNAWVLSVIVFLVAISAIGRMELWQEWINLALGAWIFVAPWVLGFAADATSAAAWDHWIVGALIFLLSLSSLSTVSAQLNRGARVTTATSVPPTEVGVQPPQTPVGGTAVPRATRQEPTRSRERAEHR